MFGISDVGIWLAYLLCILSAVLCLVYGILNWNKGDNDASELEKEAKWEQEELEIEERV